MCPKRPRFALNRREWLEGAAGLVGATGLSGVGAANDGANEDVTVPEPTRSSEIRQKGYQVEEIRDGLYYVTEGVYQMMFLVTSEGVIAVDAPPTLGRNILNAIDEVTNKPITHVVYSHFHADHIAGASIYPDDAEIIAYEKTADLLEQFDDDHRPDPTTTFTGSYNLEVGDQELELDFRGANHSPDNIFIYAPSQKVLMVVDIVFPDWVPFKHLAVSRDIPGYIDAHEKALRYDFDTLVSGHLGQLGTPEDVRLQRRFLADLKDTAEKKIETVDVGPIQQEVGSENPWALFDAYLNEVSRQTAEVMLQKWGDRFKGADVFMESHAFTMVESLRVDYGVLGPFGLPDEERNGG